MSWFVGIAALLVAASLVFVLVPLWRAGKPAANKRSEANIAVYHQRYAEIEAEVAAGRLDRRAAEQEKDELGARLLDDIDHTPTLAGDTQVRARPWIASLMVVCLMIGGAGGGYWLLGDWSAVTGSSRPDIATLIGKLKQQLDANPGDMATRALLARAQQARGRYGAAAANYRVINETIATPRPGLIAGEARARLRATGDVQGRVAQLYRQLLALDPDSVEALWYLGRAAAENADNKRALAYWDRLLARDLPDDFRNMVETRRNELAGNKPGLE